jgi:hypothetical protein
MSLAQEIALKHYGACYSTQELQAIEDAINTVSNVELKDDRMLILERDTFRKELNNILPMLGAVVYAQGGEVRIPSEALMVEYSFEISRDPVSQQTIIRSKQRENSNEY